MSDHFFVLMYATSGNERNETRFERYHDVKEAEAMVQDWLMRYVALDCVPAAKEAEIRAANGGALPEEVFLCPEVKEPKDLEGYNGFYNLGGLGRIFNVFLTPVYDRETAIRFRNGMDKEFGISLTDSDQAVELLGHLETFINAFEDPDLDDREAEEAIRTFLIQGGFSLFDGDFVPDTYVMPSGPDLGDLFSL